MKITTDEEFTNHASAILSGEELVFITRKGKPAGVYIPLEGNGLSMELRRELFFKLTEKIGQDLAEKGVTEEQVLAEFEAARKNRR